MKILFSIPAQEDLADIAMFIAEDSPVRAVSFTAELETRAKSLQHTPYKGADRSDLLDGLRLLPHGNYNIYYKLIAGDLVIARIMHAARNITADDLN